MYLVYGMHDCLNVVTEPEGRPAAVLIRAVEPLAGVAAMRRARRDWLENRRRTRAARATAAEGPAGATPPIVTADARLDALPVWKLAAGPGLVAAAFSLSRSDTGLDLLAPRSPIRLEAPAPGDRAVDVRSGPRVGIRYAPEPWRSLPWRLWDASSAAVSRAR